MAMTTKCAQMVRAAAAGRQISDAKLAAIEDAISSQMRELARRDRQLPEAQRRWASLTRDQRVAEASAKAMEALQAEAALKEYRGNLQVLRAAETHERVAQQMATSRGKMTRSQAYIADLVNTADAGHAERNRAVAELKDLIDAAESKDGTGALRDLGIRLFDLDNPQMTADIVREVFRNADGFTGNKAAQKGAQAWLSVIERMRQKFNAAGGNVGKLGYGYLSQAHDAIKVAAAGAEKWAKFVLDNNLLDREQYVRADGSLMGNAELADLLKAAHETLASGGANKTEPGQHQGAGARANRGSDQRVLHFKDGDAWMAYMKEFGEGSLYDAMLGHVGRMARDIALVERMGPNPEATHRVQADIAQRTDAPHGTAKELLAARSAGNTPDAYWRIVKGETGAPENKFIARAFSDLRNVQTAAKITWGPLSALADVGTVMQTLHFQKIPYFDYLRAYGRQFSAEQRAELRAHEVIADSVASSLNRWTGDNLTHSLTGRITNSVMKLSLMNAWTDAARNAFADVMMTNHVKHLGKEWGKLSEWDRYLMQRKGITEQDWSIITQAKPDPDSPRQLLSAPVIRATGLPGAEQAATKWAAYVHDEAQFAVVNPDIATRAIITGGGRPAGTINGEAWRSFGQFKSFPIAMLTRHWRRIFETPQGLEGAPSGYRGESTGGVVVNRVAALAALGVTTTLLGAIQTQARQIGTGKDPIDMTGEHTGKFWAKAWAAGGGAGFLADVLMAPSDDPSRQWQGHLGIAGPVAGAAGGLIDVAKSQHKAADAATWASDQLPFVDMWQTRAMYEHWLLYSAQENLNPGYLSRMQRRSMKNWGQSSWWAPGDAAPSRTPDISGAFGQ